MGMVKTRNILDAYGSLKKEDPSYVYAMPSTEVLTFFMADAHRIHEALPDVQIGKSWGQPPRKLPFP